MDSYTHFLNRGKKRENTNTQAHLYAGKAKMTQLTHSFTQNYK